jgi:hypothetical protein
VGQYRRLARESGHHPHEIHIILPRCLPLLHALPSYSQFQKAAGGYRKCIIRLTYYCNFSRHISEFSSIEKIPSWPRHLCKVQRLFFPESQIPKPCYHVGASTFLPGTSAWFVGVKGGRRLFGSCLLYDCDSECHSGLLDVRDRKLWMKENLKCVHSWCKRR